MSSIGSFTISAKSSAGITSGGLGGMFAKAIPGIGRPIYVDNNPALGLRLGGGMPGYVPQSIYPKEKGSSFPRTRRLLVDSWNTTSKSGSSYPKRIQTPFRAVNNAGDILCRTGYSCGGSCQTPQSRPGLFGLKHAMGHVGGNCTPSVIYSADQVNPAVPPSACNGKFVYDSSDYITFKRKQAVNKLYNQRSFGGDDSNGSQVARQAIRRF
jgi:hypothetical protein